MSIKDVLIDSIPAQRLYRGDVLLWERASESFTVFKVVDGETFEQSVTVGNNTGKITFPLKEGYLFYGWFQDEGLSIPANFENISSDMTVYAGYIRRADVTLSMARKSGKVGDVTFTATVSIKNVNKFIGVGVLCDHTGEVTEEVLTKKTYVNVGSTSHPKYIYKFSGPVVVKNLKTIDSFEASIYWLTKDGTRVTDKPKSCTYKGGSVKVV